MSEAETSHRREILSKYFCCVFNSFCLDITTAVRLILPMLIKSLEDTW